jgi:hypothetical protein
MTEQVAKGKNCGHRRCEWPACAKTCYPHENGVNCGDSDCERCNSERADRLLTLRGTAARLRAHLVERGDDEALKDATELLLGIDSLRSPTPATIGQWVKIDPLPKIYSLAELEAMDREETEFLPGALIETALHYCRSSRAGMEDRERAIKAQDRCDALELELVDLRLDRQRLDWLDTISYATELAGGKDLWKVNLVVPRSDETDFRKLVDAARRNPGEDEPPIRSTVTVPEGRRRLRSGLPDNSEKK